MALNQAAHIQIEDGLFDIFLRTKLDALIADIVEVGSNWINAIHATAVGFDGHDASIECYAVAKLVEFFFVYFSIHSHRSHLLCLPPRLLFFSHLIQPRHRARHHHLDHRHRIRRRHLTIHGERHILRPHHQHQQRARILANPLRRTLQRVQTRQVPPLPLAHAATCADRTALSGRNVTFFFGPRLRATSTRTRSSSCAELCCPIGRNTSAARFSPARGSHPCVFSPSSSTGKSGCTCFALRARALPSASPINPGDKSRSVTSASTVPGMLTPKIASATLPDSAVITRHR